MFEAPPRLQPASIISAKKGNDFFFENPKLELSCTMFYYVFCFSVPQAQLSSNHISRQRSVHVPCLCWQCTAYSPTKWPSGALSRVEVIQIWSKLPWHLHCHRMTIILEWRWVEGIRREGLGLGNSLLLRKLSVAEMAHLCRFAVALHHQLPLGVERSLMFRLPVRQVSNPRCTRWKDSAYLEAKRIRHHTDCRCRRGLATKLCHLCNLGKDDRGIENRMAYYWIYCYYLLFLYIFV